MSDSIRSKSKRAAGLVEPIIFSGGERISLTLVDFRRGIWSHISMNALAFLVCDHPDAEAQNNQLVEAGYSISRK